MLAADLQNGDRVAPNVWWARCGRHSKAGGTAKHLPVIRAGNGIQWTQRPTNHFCAYASAHHMHTKEDAHANDAHALAYTIAY